MLWVEEDSPEHDTVASEKVCPKVTKFRQQLRATSEIETPLAYSLIYPHCGLGTAVRFTEEERTQNDKFLQRKVLVLHVRV